MDRLNQVRAAPARARRFLPSEAPLAIPPQTLRQDGAASSCRDNSIRPALRRPRGLALRRAFVFGTTAAATVAAGFEMYKVFEVGGITVLEGVVLALFVVLFAWISLSCVSAGAGFVLELIGPARALGIDPTAPLPAVTTANALLLPTYNENPRRIMARLQAIHASVIATGQGTRIDFFVLSDTTDPDIWIGEEQAYLELIARVGSDRIFYRHRADNVGRKAGNIAEWVSRFGGRYAHMIVLDADSLMTGDTVVRLFAALEHNPDVALIQTLPVVVNGATPFARLQQFAGRLYGPLVARGVAWWHGPDGNYWGHNAAIRLAAFAANAGLPLLRGRKPFGGHILSHDFVEAALMRRAGWAIWMVPSLAGSYEETPPSLVEHIARDRRWCQGNLQHLGVLPARGLHWLSRLHLLTGIGTYVTAPLWVAILLVGVLISLEAHFVRPNYFPQGFSLFPNWPVQDPVRAAWVFAITMGILLVPKLLAFLTLLARPARRRAFGGAVRTFVGMLVEIVVSGLIAPVMMVSQSRAIADILLGRDAGWQAQRRESDRLPIAESVRRFAPHTAVGIVLGASAYAVSLPLFLWMMPVTVGLVLAIPLATFTADQRIGNGLRRAGLLLTPDMREEPEVIRSADELARDWAEEADVDAVARLAGDAELREAHREMLPPPRRRDRGDIDVHLATARARLDTFVTLGDSALFTPKEKMAALADAPTLDRLLALPGAGRTPAAPDPRRRN
ncbi:MAG TPA: glucans biosynthesis glucosyltransferase MdoH [Xanthobacteraceae bacterium]|nr:glucans biosynthesis glucosyltransferase MdoH [Xanthobacteraceae bacterium]